MFPHTPHVESVVAARARRSDDCAVLERPGVAGGQPAPDQVGVREQEAERDRRQRRQAARRPTRSSSAIVAPSAERHREPRPERAQARSARSRARKSAKKSTSGSPSRAALPPGTTNATESEREHVRVVLGDRLRRAAPDRVGVDERDRCSATSTTHESSSNAGRNSQPSARDRAELGEVREHRCVERRQEQRRDASRTTPIASWRGCRRRPAARARRARTSPASGRARRARCSTRSRAVDRCGATSYHATSAARAISRAAARPTRGRRA